MLAFFFDTEAHCAVKDFFKEAVEFVETIDFTKSKTGDTVRYACTSIVLAQFLTE